MADEIVVALHDVHDRLVHTQELTMATARDELTRVASRAAFDERLSELDADGHDAGDAVLRAVAEALVASVRPSDLVARIGGDEFAIVVREPVDRAALGVRLVAAGRAAGKDGWA